MYFCTLPSHTRPIAQPACPPCPPQRRLDVALDIPALFSAPAAESLALVRTCRAVAEGWQTHYMANRERLEASGHTARWEFSRTLLFERTNYAAEVGGEGGSQAMRASMGHLHLWQAVCRGFQWLASCQATRFLLPSPSLLPGQVCGEVEGMLAAVDDFSAFLGPELKAVTGDTGVIDEVSVMVQVGGCRRVQAVAT